MKNPTTQRSSTDREIVITRIFDAPRELVWEAWTKPEHIAYGTAKTTSLGTQPTLRSTGMPSLFGADFELTVTNAVPNSTGVAIFSASRASRPFEGGTLLLQMPTHRLAPVRLDGAGSASIPVVITPEMVGTSLDVQFWFRDPRHPDGTGIGHTDALEVQFGR